MSTNTLQEAKEFDLGAVENLESIYANGYEVAIGAGDIMIILHRNGKKIAVVNLSYTVAKTLGIGLSETVGKLEGLTGNSIMTVHTIQKKLKPQ